MEESITDEKWYNDTIKEPLGDIYIKYILLIKEYISHFNQTYTNDNEIYYKYLFIKGLQVNLTLFNMLFMYLKNLDVTYKHCQQGFFYYVEFIGQIGNDNGGFLQLSSKDAVLFVYKKTIFDINIEHKKKHEITSLHEKKILNIVNKFSLILNNIFEKIIVTEKISNEQFYSYIDRIILLCNYIPNSDIDIANNTIEIIYKFIIKLSTIDSTIELYLQLLQLFLKKLKKYTSIDKSDNILKNINLLNYNTTKKPSAIINSLFYDV